MADKPWWESGQWVDTFNTEAEKTEEENTEDIEKDPNTPILGLQDGPKPPSFSNGTDGFGINTQDIKDRYEIDENNIDNNIDEVDPSLENNNENDADDFDNSR